MNEMNRDREQGSLERMGEQIGGAAGRAMGRGTQAAAGMVGSVLGSAIDTLGAWWSSMEADRAATSFADQQDRTCREHFQSQGSSSAARSYEDVRPLYQFGYVAGQNPDYRGRAFDDVETDLQRLWDEDVSRSHGEWPEARTYIGFGYTREDPNAPRDF